ncbi:MAG: hypothetical protein IPM54_41165 [Polyangiaceae bacterium]|nr:hypothetical protein [Polyangiaceae bacterium]
MYIDVSTARPVEPPRFTRPLLIEPLPRGIRGPRLTYGCTCARAVTYIDNGDHAKHGCIIERIGAPIVFS